MNNIQGLPKGFRGKGNSPNSVVVRFLQGIIIIILDTVLYWIKGFNANKIFQVSHDGTFENAPEFFHEICVNPITDNFLRLGEDSGDLKDKIEAHIFGGGGHLIEGTRFLKIWAWRGSTPPCLLPRWETLIWDKMNAEN